MAKNLDEAGCVLNDFASASFTLQDDPSISYRAVVRNLLDEARKRQAENPGVAYADIVLRYLIGAVLELVLADKHKTVRYPRRPMLSPSTVCAGDFLIEQAAIHVTMFPSLDLMEKCKENLASGLKPIIVVTDEHFDTAQILTNAKGIANCVEIFAAEQFFATSLYKLSGFNEIERHTTIEQLIQVYNRIIDEFETDPSLRISIGR